MKKQLVIALFVIFIFIIAASAKAIITPLPIAGKIIGEYNDGVTVLITNERTQEQMTTESNEYGEWLVDWSNAKETARIGDVFIVKVGDIEKKVTFETHQFMYVEIEYDGEKPCECDCSDWLNIGAGAVIGLILGLVAFMGGGLQVYKNRLGQAVVKHRHKGILGYHDPNIKHRNPKYSHRRWKDDAMGCLMDVKKIEEEGGLN